MKRIGKPDKQANNRRVTPRMKACQWKPGQSGNPAGRPVRAKVLAEYVREVGEEIADKKSGETRIEKVIRRLYEDAAAGKVEAARLVVERGWGKAPLEIEAEKSAAEMHAELLQIARECGVDPESDPVAFAILKFYEEKAREENGGITLN